MKFFTAIRNLWRRLFHRAATTPAASKDALRAVMRREFAQYRNIQVKYGNLMRLMEQHPNSPILRTRRAKLVAIADGIEARYEAARKKL
jgi:dihydrodipicolinate synthase/N-acetylneuraminate lyase